MKRPRPVPITPRMLLLVAASVLGAAALAPCTIQTDVSIAVMDGDGDYSREGGSTSRHQAPLEARQAPAVTHRFGPNAATR